MKTVPHDSTEKLSEHFNAREFRCKCGKVHDTLISEELVQMLERLRQELSCSRIEISSGYRCAAHDKNVGGSGTGQHTKGNAADVCCYDQSGNIISSEIVCCKAEDIGFHGIANINRSHTFTHLDMRNGKWYGDETHGMSYCIPNSSFYEYFGVAKGAEKMYKGIDVSAHQGVIDWNKVKADGVEFAILRAGYGKLISQKDTKFEENYAGAKARSIPVGAYWYSYAKTPEEARIEADVFLEVISGKQFDYPVFFDLEEQSQFELGKEKVNAIIRAFLEEVEKAGYWVGLYMSASPLKTYVSDTIRNRYAIWVANYGVSKPSYSGNYGIWQYSDKGQINGISGNVDMDYCYIDYPSKIKAKGLNGYGGKPPEEEAGSTNEIKAEIEIGGKKYAGTLQLKTE